ncbi:hypothetical protein HRI_000941700 [Hibiscus trionum]|uniref:Uncharacterized protein n=1 Tax=Hibiscus trionum TaxID=183268 RepID=A0A9W7LQ14_HIBTR|nr:hypothetical protein HRI_000941700 [Hibiscus trionum]
MCTYCKLPVENYRLCCYLRFILVLETILTFKASYFLLFQQVFTRVGEMSAVYKQPTCKEDRLQALQALLSCPTNLMRTEVPPPDILEAQKPFPIPIDEKKLPGVYHCGYHSPKSYGASSYLIVHSDGNLLIDRCQLIYMVASVR